MSNEIGSGVGTTGENTNTAQSSTKEVHDGLKSKSDENMILATETHLHLAVNRTIEDAVKSFANQVTTTAGDLKR